MGNSVLIKPPIGEYSIAERLCQEYVKMVEAIASIEVVYSTKHKVFTVSNYESAGPESSDLHIYTDHYNEQQFIELISKSKHH